MRSQRCTMRAGLPTGTVNSTVVWKRRHLPSRYQRAPDNVAFLWACTTASAPPSARLVHRSVAPVAEVEENVTDLPSGVHAGIKLSFMSTVNLMLGPRSSRLIQIPEGDSTLAALASATDFPSGESVGVPM